MGNNEILEGWTNEEVLSVIEKKFGPSIKVKDEEHLVKLFIQAMKDRVSNSQPI